MLGVLWMTVCGIAKVITDRKEYVHNREARSNHQTKYGTYYDYHARERDVNTGKFLKTTVNDVGDIIQKSNYKTIVRNISEEQRLGEFENNKNNPNRKYSCYVWNRMDRHNEQKDKDIRDVWHVDYDTGDIYVVKKVTDFKGAGNETSLDCYMNIKTKKFVRITDIQKKTLYRLGMTEEDVRVFIDRANKREGCFIIQPVAPYGSIGVPTWEEN